MSSGPLAFRLSCLFGALGVALIAVGFIAGWSAVSVAGFAFGSASLIAALAWRSELIAAWHRDPAHAPGQAGRRPTRR